MMCDVSVVIPVYRPGDVLLTRAIESVFKDNDVDTEVVLAVDDGLDYGHFVGDRVKAYATPSPASGPGPARTFGKQHARGQHAVYLDSDDDLSPGFVPCLWPLAKAKGSAASNTLFIEDGNEIYRSRYTDKIDYEDYIRSGASTWGMFELRPEQRFLDITSEDFVFFLEELSHRQGVMPVGPAFYRAHVNPNSVSHAPGFVQRVQEGYQTHLDNVRAGGYQIDKTFRPHCELFFERRLDVNAAYEASGMNEDFYTFSARYNKEVPL